MNISSVESLKETVVLDESIKRLCHFMIPLKGHNLREELHGFLIVQCLSTLPEGSYPPERIKERLYQQFNLRFEIDEIEPALKYLVQQRQIESDGKGNYTLTPNRRSEIVSQIARTQESEKEVLGVWLNTIKDKYQALGNTDLETLKNDLKHYLIKICRRHGAECSVLLYPSKEAEEFISQLEQTFGAVVTDRPEPIKTIRQIEYPLFIKHLTSSGRKYLSDLLNSAYLVFILHLDKTCSALVQEQFKGITVYLDTNFLFNLLGASGERRKKSAESVINLSKKFRCKLVVSYRTRKEWDASIGSTERELKGPVIRFDLAELAARYTREEDLTHTYWARYAETGISVRDFLAPFKRLKDLLDRFDIKSEDKLWNKISDGAELKEEVNKLTKALGQLKPIEAVREHDAFHRLLIIRLRGQIQPRKFMDTKFWFLTCDTSLLKYHQVVRKNPQEIPFCILAEQWVQIMRPFVERTDDYDSASVGLLTSPYLRTFAPLPEDVVKSILGRISLYKHYPPSLATKMMVDASLTEQLHKLPEEKRYELIDNKAAEIAAQMEIELKKVTDEHQKQKIYAEQLGKQKESLRLSLEESQKQARETQEKLDIEKQQRERLEKIIKYGKIIGISLLIIILFLILRVFKVL